MNVFLAVTIYYNCVSRPSAKNQIGFVCTAKKRLGTPLTGFRSLIVDRICQKNNIKVRIAQVLNNQLFLRI